MGSQLEVRARRGPRRRRGGRRVPAALWDARVEAAEELSGSSKSRRAGGRLELSSLPFWASCPDCQATFVVLRTPGGAAAPPPFEEPEPQDARGRAAALRAQFRRPFPAGSRALTLRVRPRSSPPACAAPDLAASGSCRPRHSADDKLTPRA